MPTDNEVMAAAKAMCKADGTAQCAAICLSYSSHFTRNGECPEAFRVHGRKARAALAAAERVQQVSQQERAMGVIDEVVAEHKRQMDGEGWSHEHDDRHKDGSIALAAALYVEPDLKRLVPRGDGGVSVVDPWPWRWSGRVGSGNNWDKRAKYDRRRRLVIAAALLVAEIERIDRAQS